MAAARADQVLALVDALQAELHPGQAAPARLDSSLERELGLDSLARAELLLRTGAAFGVDFADEVLAQIETPADLLRALNAARASDAAATKPMSSPTQDAVGAASADVPTAATTLVEVLLWHAERHPQREHILFYANVEHTESLTYGGLLAAAQTLARGLREAGLQRGQTVAIMLPSSLEFFHAFYGTLLAGGVPVALYPPARMAQIEDHLRRQAGILNSCLAPLLITVAAARPLARLLRLQVGSLRRIVTVAELSTLTAATTPDLPLPVLSADDIVMLQYTSGSTGNPKGVIVSHANLLANIRAWTVATALTSADVCVSWLPLYHDMGLIGACFGSLYTGCRLVLMSPLTFLAHPEHWLRCIARHRGSVAAAPNFAYELCLRHAERNPPTGLDLSSWRLAANGAETVRAETLERFNAHFAACGLAPTALTPMYGLAEATLGVAIPRLGRPPRIDCVRRDGLQREGRALPAGPDEPTVQRFVSCGRVLPGHELRIVDADGVEQPERVIGRIQFRGPSATRGYFRNAEETRRLFHADWLETGDLGYLADAELHITGRIKDMIIRAGRNLYPDELESAIGQLPGVRRGGVAVFASADAALGDERLVAVVESRTGAAADLKQRIAALAVDILGVPLDDVVLAPPHSVLKTSSGKLRRGATRAAYQAGNLGATQHPPWRQLVRLAVAACGTGLRRAGQRLGALAWGAWTWACLIALSVPVWCAVVLAQHPARAWALCHRAARLLVWLGGLRLTVHGSERLPQRGPCVLVANHASYLDGLLLMALLRQPCCFIAKRELAAQRIAGPFLRGLGAEFVERFDARGSLDDSRRATCLAAGTRPLIFFAEGTLTRASGLRPFHHGAFVAAAGAGATVVPLALQGSRELLRDETWWPRRVALSVHIGATLRPAGAGWADALALNNAARAYILAHCGEPDLAR